MKPLFLFLALALPSATALGGGGGMSGGATEVTQIMNNVQLADAYAQQTLQYQNQLLQYQTMLKNLAEHPVGNISPTLNAIASNSAKIMQASSDIGSTMARVDQNFADQFKNPKAASFAERFRGLTTTTHDALRAAMLNSGLQRENFRSDEAALIALVDKNQRSDGNLGAIKTLGEINAQQLQEQMKLRDLISQQQLATGSYMAAQAAKQQETQDLNDRVGQSTPAPGPLVLPAKGKFKF